MDKWVVNNYIVRMRSGVIQARVQILNKLVREIRKLQNKKGSAQQKEKNQRKAERFKQEVFLIKKLEPNDVSKFALLFKDDPEDELKRVSISLEERAKMRIIAHKSVVQHVEIFRMKYPDWELKLPPLLVQLGLKNKYKNKSELQTTSPKRNPVAKSSVENDEKENNILENSDHNSDSVSSVNEIFSRNTVSSGKDDKKVKMSSKICEEYKKKDKANGIAKVHRIADSMESDDNSESSTEHEQTSNPKKNIICEDDEKKKKSNSIAEIHRLDNSESSREHENKFNSMTNILSKGDAKKKQANSIAEIRRFADLVKSDENSENSTEHKKRLNPKKNEKEKKANDTAEVHRFSDLAETDGSSNESEDSKLEYEKLNPTNTAVDPFFLTGDNSDAGDDAGESDEFDSDGEESNQTRFSQNSDRGFSSFNSKRNQTFGRFDRPNGEKHASFRSDQKVPTLNRKQRRMLERAKAENKGESVSELIKEFFPRHVNSSVKTKVGRFLGQGLKKENTSEKEEKLHPSWEAKRKLKEQQFLPFQGKKIKFDENDE